MDYYLLPDHLRTKLKNPIGKLIMENNINKTIVEKECENSKLKVSVGDATTERLIFLDLIPDVEIVDGKEMRKSRNLPKSNYKTLLKTYNPPGSLTKDAIVTTSNALSSIKPVRIFVKGEEDLLVIPILANYPLNTIVIYGQPLEGLVFVYLNLKSKSFARSILKEMGASFI